MAASKIEGKCDWVLINNMLQWAFLISVVIYLAVEKTGSIKSNGELDARLKRHEAMFKENEQQQGNSLAEKQTDKETCLKRIEGKEVV